jgi:hypothetical protein
MDVPVGMTTEPKQSIAQNCEVGVVMCDKREWERHATKYDYFFKIVVPALARKPGAPVTRYR